MAKQRKPFGQKNAPPPVLNAPGGLPDGAPFIHRRKMSMTVGLVSLGAATLAGGVYYESRHRAAQAEECRAEAARRGLPPDNCPPAQSSSRSHSSGGHSWFWSSGSSHSSSTTGYSSHGTSTSSGHATFGGFGHSGAAHAGGS